MHSFLNYGWEVFKYNKLLFSISNNSQSIVVFHCFVLDRQQFRYSAYDPTSFGTLRHLLIFVPVRDPSLRVRRDFYSQWSSWISIPKGLKLGPEILKVLFSDHLAHKLETGATENRVLPDPSSPVVLRRGLRLCKVDNLPLPSPSFYTTLSSSLHVDLILFRVF